MLIYGSDEEVGSWVEVRGSTISVGMLCRAKGQAKNEFFVT